jgi:hypothetical protein
MPIVEFLAAIVMQYQLMGPHFQLPKFEISATPSAGVPVAVKDRTCWRLTDRGGVIKDVNTAGMLVSGTAFFLHC